eukprot:COSAG06_NODE_53744_length_298_cov_0.783920_1_plen_34_part_10
MKRGVAKRGMLACFWFSNEKEGSPMVMSFSTQCQ